MGEAIHVNDSTFQSAVLESKLPVVVDFWAPWCGPCRMVAPSLDRIAEEYSGRLIVAKVNTDENGAWANHYGVQRIPTMLFVANGEVVHQEIGAVPHSHIKAIVDRYLVTPGEPVDTVRAEASPERR